MANFLLIDGFDHYTTADIGKKWTAANIGSISAGTGRNGTASMRIVGSQNGPQFSVSNLPTVYVGFAFKLQNAGATMHMLRLLDGASIQLDMGITPSNFMVVKRGGATVVSTATTNALSAGAYYFLEARFTLHASAGSCEVRVNGVTVINDTGLNLITSANAYMNSVMLMSAAGTGNHDFDDFYLTTDAFLGDCRVVALRPFAAGSYSQWTPSDVYLPTVGTGARPGITITDGGTVNAVTAICDGDVSTGNIWGVAGVTSSRTLRFDLGTGYVVGTIVIWFQSTGSQGVWQWQGSNDATAWTNLGISFTMAATNPQVLPLSNSTSYRYYRIIGVSGSTASGPTLNEVEFLGPGAAGYQCVDDPLTINGDIDYVSSAVAGQRNSYDFAPVGFTGNVKAVQQITTLRKDDAGSRTAQQFARVSGADYDGTNITVLDSYAMQRRIMTVNPATGAGWNTSDIDSAEFGTKIVS